MLKQAIHKKYLELESQLKQMRILTFIRAAKEV